MDTAWRVPYDGKRMMRKHLDLFVAALVLPSALAAQADTVKSSAIFGVVYDSVARAPIPGAIVQIVLASNPAGAMRTATTDQRGRYEVINIEPGRYIAGFHHGALDSLALEVPPRRIEVASGQRTRVDMAVPSPATIVTAACGRGWMADSTGLVVGMLSDARTRMSLGGGTVRARWHEIVLDASGLRHDDKIVTSAVTASGWFALCGVPGAVDVALLGWLDADSTGEVLASVPMGGIARRDLLIRGVATVRGSVLSERRQPIAIARIGVIGRDRIVSADSAGRFHLGDIPAGSQTLEFRALGHAPEHRLLHLPDGADTTITVTLTSMRKVLDTIQVVARRLYDKSLDAFERRRRFGGGYFLDEATIRRRRPHDILQLLYTVPSVRVIQQGFERSVWMRGNAFGSCQPDLFVNGMRMSADLAGDIDLLARPEELVAMEVYQAGQAPAEFMSFTGCGAIVLWTRPPPRAPRRPPP
jgi:hypothetical protein